jgi:MFS family permease
VGECRPTLAYRLYAQEWHLTHTTTTGIFAVFPIAVVAMLVGFGGISDQIGRRAAMLLGLGASLIGTVFFAVAPNVWWVLPVAPSWAPELVCRQALQPRPF